MSQAIRSFLKLLTHKDPIVSVSESWDNLTLEQQREAVELSRASDTMEMKVPAVIGYDLDEILAS